MATEVIWSGPKTSHGVAIVLQSLFALPDVNQSYSLTAVPATDLRDKPFPACALFRVYYVGYATANVGAD